MYKIINIFFVSVLMTSCAVKNTINNKELCEILNKMDHDDQVNRNLMTYKTKSYGDVFHSLLNEENISVEEYKNLSEVKKIKYRNKVKKILKNSKPRELTKYELVRNDSLMSEQIRLDNDNTKYLLNIIKKRGYPNKENCSCKLVTTPLGDYLPGIIFRHSQPKYFKKIKKAIDVEFKEGRMSEKTYKLIIDHINGRPKSK